MIHIASFFLLPLIAMDYLTKLLNNLKARVSITIVFALLIVSPASRPFADEAVLFIIADIVVLVGVFSAVYQTKLTQKWALLLVVIMVACLFAVASIWVRVN